ncbi:MAG TPA: PD-(D/E)XK nuclease family protein [Armatimonadota bacterium]|nr:PD-(D/E)XK nuclease family protein [Armatimonadota bacterium]
MRNSLDNLFFSQLALSTYLTCQLKFRRRYLEELYWPQPGSPAIELGTDFHAAAERYYLTGQQVQYPGKLGELIQELYRFRPADAETVFLPEAQLRMATDIRLLAKYDLLVLADRIYIYDWKTDEKKIKPSYYRSAMQTIVYRYLMVVAGSGYWPGRVIQPHDVVMCYWNPRYPTEPLYLEYSERQFKQDGTALRKLISEIKSKAWNEFLIAGDKKACSFCEYSPLCHGKPREEAGDYDGDDLSLSWDEIEEIQY